MARTKTIGNLRFTQCRQGVNIWRRGKGKWEWQWVDWWTTYSLRSTSPSFKHLADDIDADFADEIDAAAKEMK